MVNMEIGLFAVGGIFFFIGSNLLRLGYKGAIDRFNRSETVDSKSDELNHIINSNKEDLKDVFNTNTQNKRICKQCGAINHIDHTFCFDCGEQIKTKN